MIFTLFHAIFSKIVQIAIYTCMYDISLNIPCKIISKYLDLDSSKRNALKILENNPGTKGKFGEQHEAF